MPSIAPVLLTSGTGLTTASVDLSLTRRYVVAVMSYGFDGDDTIGLSGGGLDWELVEAIHHSFGTEAFQVLAVFSASGKGEAGALAITSSRGLSGTSVGHFVVRIDDAGVVVQHPEANGTSAAMLVTMAKFGSDRNGVLAFFTAMALLGALTMTPGSGYTQLGSTLANGNNWRFFAEWRADNDLSVDASQSNTRPWAGIALEVAYQTPPVAGAPSSTGFYPRSNLRAAELWRRRQQQLKGPRFRPRL